MMKNIVQPGWYIIFSREFHRIWLGWGGPLFLLTTSLCFSIYVVLLAIDPEINVISQQKMIDQTLSVTIFVGMVVVLLIGANSISGERDSKSLETLLLTPIPRWQLAIGKLLTTLSLWIGLILISIPYLALIAKGTDTLAVSLFILLIPGTLLIILSAGIGVLVSGLAPTNFFSFLCAVSILLLIAAPILVPNSVKELPVVAFIMLLNPITAVAGFQTSAIADSNWTESLQLLISPFIAAALSLSLVPYVLNKKLTLLGGLSS